MRRSVLHALIMFSLPGMTGCNYVPSFPDLWPFDDQPVAADQQAQLSTQLPSVKDGAEAVVSSAAPAAIEPAIPTAAEATPTVEADELVTQLTPTLSGVDGATASVPGAVAYIISPPDGAVLTNPVRVLFGLDRMGIAPITSTHDGTGHHHLLIDTELPPLDRSIPADENHRHFSGGQTETTLNLPPGEHTLQLLLGDHTHTPHQPPVASRKISITVQ